MAKFINLKNNYNETLNIDFINVITEEVINDKTLDTSGSAPYDYFNETMFIKSQKIENQTRTKIQTIDGREFFSFESKKEFMTRLQTDQVEL